jgi:hypothetical protein
MGPSSYTSLNATKGEGDIMNCALCDTAEAFWDAECKQPHNLYYAYSRAIGQWKRLIRFWRECDELTCYTNAFHGRNSASWAKKTAYDLTVFAAAMDSNRHERDLLTPILREAKAHYHKILAPHPRCAACTIYMGEGHIMDEWVIVDGRHYCPTCPKHPHDYTDEDRELDKDWDE